MNYLDQAPVSRVVYEDEYNDAIIDVLTDYQEVYGLTERDVEELAWLRVWPCVTPAHVVQPEKG